MPEFERILNINLDQLKILATNKGITFASSITKPEMQILVLSEVNKASEQSVIQVKLQLVEADKQKAEAETLKLDADFEYQSRLICLRHEDSERNARIAQELEARKRDEAECCARIAQERGAQKRDEAKCVARIANERELREQAEKERFAFSQEQSRIKHEFEKERCEQFF